MKLIKKCKHCGNVVEVEAIAESDELTTCPICFHSSEI